MRSPDAIVGIHPVEEALASGRAIRQIYLAAGVAPSKAQTILSRAAARHIPVLWSRREELDRLARGRLHQGVVAVAPSAGYRTLESVILRAQEAPPALVVALDQVQDPQNLGAVVRTAETAGAHGVVVAGRRTAPLSAAVRRASAGAMEHLPIARVTNLVNGLKELKQNDIWVVGVDPAGELPWTGFDYRLPVALVFGGEHRGIRRLVSEQCDVRVRLPVRGKVASLNVSVAAGIVLYEVVRQRLAPGPSDGSGESPRGAERKRRQEAKTGSEDVENEGGNTD